MACDALHTGTQFLSTALAHLDCQGRTIGSYGYGALADPRSAVALSLTAVLTIFIALLGIRLLTGDRPGSGGLAYDAARIGVFLALATSWPAWRSVGYNLVMDGPLQIAQSISLASGLPGSSNDLTARLQDADDGIVTLTTFGSGRLTGGLAISGEPAEAARGIALTDQSALGSGRAMYLATIIGASGLLRIGAGILLALAPLMAGLLLFAGTMPVFMGWVRGLAFCALGSLAFHIIAGAELALLYPWLSDVLSQRQVNVFTPSAPTELLVLALAFATITVGTLVLLARVTFLPAVFVRHFLSARETQKDQRGALRLGGILADPGNRADRAAVVSSAVATSLVRETDPTARQTWDDRRISGARGAQSTPIPATVSTGQEQRLGSSWRRGSGRITAAGRKRDNA